MLAVPFTARAFPLDLVEDPLALLPPGEEVLYLLATLAVLDRHLLRDAELSEHSNISSDMCDPFLISSLPSSSPVAPHGDLKN